MFIHRDLLRTISHAKGTPATKSKAATSKPIVKEFAMAPRAVFIKSGWLSTVPTEGVFMRIPIMGGIKITAKKITIAER